MYRQSVVAGIFYPGEPDAIDAMIDAFTVDQPEIPLTDAIGLVVPHAGYRYSGAVAAHVFSRVKLPGPAILFGPNHRAAGSSVYPPGAALFGEGSWRMPHGDLPIDAELTRLLIEETDLLVIDPAAHLQEHSLEVELPMLARFADGPVSLAPVTVYDLTPDECREIGEGVARAITRSGRKVTLVASTDFSHYVPKAKARKEDRLAIDRIVALDGPGLLDTVAKRGISMCGAKPVAIVIAAARELGATKGELVEYRTSGDVSGDDASVVGYGGLIIR